MRQTQSTTANGGITIIIDGSLDQTHEDVRRHLKDEIARFKRMSDEGKPVWGYTKQRTAVHKLNKAPLIDWFLNGWEHCAESDVLDELMSLYPKANGEEKAIIRTIAKEWGDLADDERIKVTKPEPYDRPINEWLDNFIPKQTNDRDCSEMDALPFYLERKDALDRFNKCVEDIEHGNGPWRDEVRDLVQRIMHTAIDLNTSLAQSYGGGVMGSEGFVGIPELIAQGEEDCIMDHDRQGGDLDENATAADGAYRIVICTDQSPQWQTSAEMTSMMGALVLLLQMQRPVELWIQQGWLGEQSKSGVTLYKMDFTKGFDPTLLSFWCGNPDRDVIYSSYLNDTLRSNLHGDSTSVCPEIPCDLYIHEWMEGYGLNKWANMEQDERIKAMAAWVTEQYCRVVSDELTIQA
jgi:hypothetical protein